jgi:hypothetical protein
MIEELAPTGSLLERAGFNQPAPQTGHGVVDLLMGAAGHAETVTDAREVLGQLLLKVQEAADILASVEPDGEARQAALRVLTGRKA